MTAPEEVLREKVKAIVALSLEQISVAIDAYCDVAKLSVAQPRLQPPQLPKDKDELDVSNLMMEAEYGRKRPASPDPEDESSGEHEPNSFINDDPVEDYYDDQDDDDDDDEDPEEEQEDQPKTRSKAKTKTPPKKQSTRVRREPKRYSPSRRGSEEDGEDEQGIDLQRQDSGGVPRLDHETWAVMRKKKPDQIVTGSWYKRRWGDTFDMVRSGLGRESANNKLPRQIWDALAENPSYFRLHERVGTSLERCAFCGCQRECSAYFAYNDRWQYLGSCCARLFLAWQAFQREMHSNNLKDLSLLHMDALFVAVRDAHVHKSSGRKHTK